MYFQQCTSLRRNDLSKSIFRLGYHNHYFIWVEKYLEKETFQSGVLFRLLFPAFPLAKYRWYTSFVLSACSVCPCLITWLFTVAQFCQISSLRNSHRPSDLGSSWQTVLANEATNIILYCPASLLFRLSCSVSSAGHRIAQQCFCVTCLPSLSQVPRETPLDCPQWGTCVYTDTTHGACAAIGPWAAAPPKGRCQNKAARGTQAASPGNLLPWYNLRRAHGCPSGWFRGSAWGWCSLLPSSCPPPASVGELHA